MEKPEEKQKKSRVNYTKAEKDDLKRQLLNYPILTSKETNNCSLRSKQEAWEKITKEFNAIPEHSIKRTVVQIKKLWENMKNEHKRKLTNQKVAVLQTGGGAIQTDTVPDDPTMEILTATADIELRMDAKDSDSLSKNQCVFSSLYSDVSMSSTSNPLPVEIVQVNPIDEFEVDVLEEEIRQEEELAEREQQVTEQDIKQYKRTRTMKAAKKTRESIVDLFEERKKIMKIEHEKKMKILEEQNKAKLSIFDMKLRAMEAKRRYYEMKTYKCMIPALRLLQGVRISFISGEGNQ